jgi:hypothetical protein
MQFKNITRSNIRLVEGKLCLELPDEAIMQMKLSALDSLDFSLGKNYLKLWKSPKREITQDIYDELHSMFKGNEQIISEWLSTPRIQFEGKAANELMDSSEGIKTIQDFIWQLKTGDFS